MMPIDAGVTMHGGGRLTDRQRHDQDGSESQKSGFGPHGISPSKYSFYLDGRF
jgi:hypothetical protein